MPSLHRHTSPSLTSERCCPWPRWLPLATVLLLAASLVTAPLAMSPRALAQDDDPVVSVADRVNEIFEDIADEATGSARIWSFARELEGLGGEAVDSILDRLDLLDGQPRLVAAKAALTLSDEIESDELAERARAAGMRALLETARNQNAEVPVRVAAVDLVASLGERREVAELRDSFDDERWPLVKVAMARALRLRNNDRGAEDLLKDYLASEEREIRHAAAMALAEAHNVEAAKSVLSELKNEPTTDGQRARLYLELDDLYQAQERTAGLTEGNDIIELKQQRIEELEREVGKLKKDLARGGDSKPSTRDPLLAELMRKIELYYVNGEKTQRDDLLDAAAKGLVGMLDPFSSYMTEKETNKFRETLGQEYAGIGAVVQVDPRTRYLTIIRPIYSGPAYEAGLRSLDQVVEVEGESTYNRTVEDLVGKLKGPQGTPVKIKVFRKGWRRPREFVLTRRRIVLVSVKHDMLPGNIGYLNLAQFGEKANVEVEAALTDLEERGMRALIFDLRGNPGGLLNAAVQISDKFLKDDQLIVYSEGRNPQIAPRKEFRTSDRATHPDYPIVVLVDGSSASASEIVSGALQDTQRATLVGRRTFGKGSVQQLMQVEATDRKSTLRLTVAYYYLPSGRCIHREPGKEGGVVPDVEVTLPEDPASVIEARDKLVAARVAEKFVQRSLADKPELLKELANFDQFDTSRYPGFDEWFAGLNTHLDPEQVRPLVRGFARRLVQDARGQEFAFDLQEDIILQHGVVEVLKLMGETPANHEPYGLLAERLEIARATAEAASKGLEVEPPLEFEDEKADPESPEKPKQDEPEKPKRDF